MAANDSALKAMFQKVYDSNVWAGPGAPKSGGGSTLENSSRAREAIKMAVTKYGVKTFIDSPCGDLTWMRTLFPWFEENGVKYIGVDVVKSEIDNHIEKYKKDFPTFEFFNYNLVTDLLPKADMLFSRQALQHMNVENNVRVLNNWKASGSKWLLQTTYTMDLAGMGEKQNFIHIDQGTSSLIDFSAEPYNFPPPVEKWKEQDKMMNVQGENLQMQEHLALWALQ